MISSTLPPGTAFNIEFEGADDPLLGPFSGYQPTVDAVDGWRHLRYRVTLTGTLVDTPVIDGITISYQ